MRERFGATAGAMVRRVFVSLIVFALFVAATGWLFSRVPTGFLPLEDKGALMGNIQLPDGASFSRTKEVAARASTMLKEIDGVPRYLGGTRLQSPLRRGTELCVDHLDHGSLGPAYEL